MMLRACKSDAFGLLFNVLPSLMIACTLSYSIKGTTTFSVREVSSLAGSVGNFRLSSASLEFVSILSAPLVAAFP